MIIMNSYKHYKSPIIAPPIKPDNPDSGKPTDHSTPVCIPHTDRHSRPIRSYRLHKYRPLPDSSLAKFGQWVMNEEWDCIDESLPPTEQVAEFERLTQEKLNQFCPEKTMKISSQDKVWITEELKKIHRLKSREYIKHGKSVKYKSLSKEFLTKFKLESQKYMQKQMNELKETNPGCAYRILKKMGAMPSDCSGNNNFTLPGHE